jgi:hypothetical protein
MLFAITDPVLLARLCQAEWRVELRGRGGQLIGYFRPLVCSLDEPTPFQVTALATVEQLRRIDQLVDVCDPAGRVLGRFEPLGCKRLRKDERGRGLRAGGGRSLQDILADLERRYGS